jgi:hypothetical protein
MTAGAPVDLFGSSTIKTATEPQFRADTQERVVFGNLAVGGFPLSI